MHAATAMVILILTRPISEIRNYFGGTENQTIILDITQIGLPVQSYEMNSHYRLALLSIVEESDSLSEKSVRVRQPFTDFKIWSDVSAIKKE